MLFLFEHRSPDLVIAFIVQSCLGFLFFLAFGWIRDDLIIYRTRLVHPNCSAVRPPRLPVGQPYYKRVFSWIAPVIRIRQSELLATAGLDALMFDKVMSWGIMFFGPLVVMGIGIILPVNFFGGVIQNNEDPDNVANEDFSLEFMRMTMGNVQQNSSLLYVHFFATYAVVAWASYTLYLKCKQYSLLKREYMGSISSAGQWQGEFQDPLFHNVKVRMDQDFRNDGLIRSASADSLDLGTPRNSEEQKGTVELQPIGGSNFQGLTPRGDGTRRRSGKDLETPGKSAENIVSEDKSARSDLDFEPKLKWYGGPEMWLKDVPMTARDLLNPLESKVSDTVNKATAKVSDIESAIEKEASAPAPASLERDESEGYNNNNEPATSEIKEESMDDDGDNEVSGSFKYAAPAHQYAVLVRDVPLPKPEGQQKRLFSWNTKELMLVTTKSIDLSEFTTSKRNGDSTNENGGEITKEVQNGRNGEHEFQVKERASVQSAQGEVELVFSTLFPGSFSKVIPVRNHKKVISFQIICFLL